jgi:hypothetical protein
MLLEVNGIGIKADRGIRSFEKTTRMVLMPSMRRSSSYYTTIPRHSVRVIVGSKGFKGFVLFLV